MTTPAAKLYPSAPLDPSMEQEESLGKKVNDVNNFYNSNININEMIVLFKEKNHKSGKNEKNHKTINSFLESVDTVDTFEATTISVTLSVAGVGLLVVRNSTGFACASSLSNE